VKSAGWLILALAIGFAAGLWTGSRGSPVPGVNPATRDSLAAALATIDTLEDARNRARVRAWEDSIALATIAGRVRVRPIPAPANPTPADTATIPDTVTVFEVPAPVAALVTRLEARNLSLAAALDTTTLQLYAERNARLLAESIAEQAERALEAERRRKWRYRLEGAGVGGIVSALVILIVAL
jgi:hypothetical protein